MDLSNTPNHQRHTQRLTEAEAVPDANLRPALDRLRAAYVANRMPSVDWRRQQLSRLEAMLRDNIDEICVAIAADFGHRSHHETQLLELFPAIAAIKHARRHVSGWMKPRRSWASMWFLPARNEIRPQPLGVVGIIVPWNYPILLAVAPLVGALAAGNRAFIKMSEFTPRTGALFAKLIETYFSNDEVLVVNGGADVARAFSMLPFDHLLFTGSTTIGKLVMQAAAEHLTPVTLELGGKSPAVIGPDADITSAVSRIMFGKCLNAGQTCIAPDYVLVPRGKEVEFIDAARRFVSTHYPTIAANADYTSLVSQRHLSRLHGYLDEARAAGATVYPLNGAGESLDGTQKLAPTIVTGACDDCRLLQEEIFGPILPLIPYDGLDSAIGYINARPRPLALYYFGHDRRQIDQVLDETVTGGVSINETLLHISQEDLPFGGVGPSGMGAYHGKVGFDTFSKSKPIFHQSRFNGLAMFQPPFGQRFEALIRFLLK
ncbi:MAG: coniferyl aldehyde dehydrogenase [Betaproteobacteria bacterium]|jgi:acyl-CoA reductase-like NAD-dependent aldehyde dehydrogenase